MIAPLECAPSARARLFPELAAVVSQSAVSVRRTYPRGDDMRRWLIVALVSLFALPAAAQDLALKRVMLSSGGLGYFEYEAQVEGDASLKLTVSLDQVDDVLKSLVVYDDKGGVGGLSLPGREPLAQAFKDLPFDQESLSSPSQLLATMKGAQVTVGGSRSVSGRIVSVQEETISLGTD